MKAWIFVAFLLVPYAAAAENFAFLYALDSDYQTLLKEGSLVRTLRKGDLPIAMISVGGHTVYAAKTGAGSVSAARAADAVLSTAPCTALFSVGVVGALSKDDAKIGTWYRVGEIVAYQSGSQTRDRLEPLASLKFFVTADPPPGTSTATVLPPLKVASGESFVTSAAVRDSIRKATGAGAVDMTLFGIAAVAQGYKVPLIATRVVSDNADENAAKDFDAFVKGYDGTGGARVAAMITNFPAQKAPLGAFPALDKLMKSGQ